MKYIKDEGRAGRVKDSRIFISIVHGSFQRQMQVECRTCNGVCRARRTVREVNNTKNATAQTKVFIEVTCPEGREGGCEENVLGGDSGGEGEGEREVVFCTCVER